MKKQYLLATLLSGLLGLAVCAQSSYVSTGFGVAASSSSATAVVTPDGGARKAAPNGSNAYYKNADGKSGAELKTALSKIIRGSLSVVGYSGLDEKYKITDKKANGELRDWYDNSTHYSWTTGGWNKEHLVPQSWFQEKSPMKSDIVHVVPTDSKANNDRGSYPLAEVGAKSSKCTTTYCIYGSCKTPGYTGTVYEPNDEIKGDIARIYFYMATCYEDVILTWKGNSTGSTAYIVIDHSGGSKYQPYKQWYMDMLMRWAKDDPVDEVEIARNNGVYTVQKNRNPFVDYPGLEDYVWGDKVDQPFSYDNYDSEVAFVARPTFESQANDDGTVTVSISAAGDAAIYYTLDGTDPTTGSEAYTGPFDLGETTTLKAIAVTGEAQSGVAEETFYVSTGGETPPAGEGSYVRVSSTSQLVSGAYYLLVYESSDSEGMAMSEAADKAENSEAVAIDGNTIDEGGLPFVLTKLSDGSWTISAGGTYLAHSAKKNNIETATSGSSATAQWTISVSGSGADIVNKSTDYAIRFNKNEGQKRFRCYAQGKQEPIALYIRTQGTEDGIGVAERQPTDGRQPVFTIDGRMVTSTATLPRGVYIVGGKKVVVK